MNNIYMEQAEVSEAIVRVKNNQDKVLDVYDDSNKKLKALMKELVHLENELEDLDNEYSVLIKEAF